MERVRRMFQATVRCADVKYTADSTVHMLCFVLVNKEVVVFFFSSMQQFTEVQVGGRTHVPLTTAPFARWAA